MRRLVVCALLAAGCAGQQPAALWRDPAVPGADPQAARVEAVARLFADGLYDRARPEITALADEGAAHPLVPWLRARLAELDGDWEGCIAWSRRAAAANPTWGEPRVLLARACLEAGRVGDADAAFADVDRLLPDNPWGPYGRAWVAARQGEPARAAALADEAIARDPGHLPSLGLRATLARQLGEAALEERLLRVIAAAGDPDAAVLARLGELAAAAGRRLDAARAYERAWALRPSRELARRLAELARQGGDLAAAQAWDERAGAR